MAALTWVCRSSSPQGLTLEAAFMVFPMTLTINWLPARSPSAAVLWDQRLPGLGVVPSPEGFARITQQCFWVVVPVKQENLLERGPGLTSGAPRKTFRLSGQRRKSWCGSHWPVKAPPLALLRLKSPNEPGAGVPS